MTPIRRKCFPLFSFIHFIAWLMPWPWVCDSWIYSQAPRETSFPGEPTVLEAQTNESLLVSDNDLNYLTREEAEQIIEHFEELPQSYDRLLFWTGIPRKWAQKWADDHSMLTFSSAMGPLMDSTDKRCLRRTKKSKQWSKYIKGACIIFARYACKRGIVRVLTLPPYWAAFIRPQSTYRNIEEPVLKGRSGCCGAVQINAVYLLTTLEELEYQAWPENRIPERLSCKSVDRFSFRLPPWTRKAVDTAAKSLRNNVINLTASTTPKPATVSVMLQGSVKVAGEPATAKQPRGGKESRSNTNGEGIIQSKSSQPRNHEQQPQSQQPLSKKKKKKQHQQRQQQQTQLSQGKNQQLQSHQPQSKEKQPQTQQSPSKNKQPQIQLLQSKNKKPLSQQTQSKKQRPQSPQTSSKKMQPPAQELSSKKKQPKPQQSPSKKEQLQKQQTQNHQPQSKKPQPQNSKQPQQDKRPQNSKKLMTEVGA